MKFPYLKLRMRKRYKNKQSCILCKPHKTGHSLRWDAQEFNLRKDFEKEKLAFLSLKNEKASICQ